MTVKVENVAKEIDKKGQYDYPWFKWKVYLDEPDDVLDKIKEVVYQLHPTFPNPKRVVKERVDGFPLESEGWGSFTVLVTIRYKDGREETIPYFLDLTKPWP